jgi:hypothetical protein
MSQHGNLFRKDEQGGADAVYDGAYTSDFAKAASKPSANFSAAKPRFEVKEQAPDVDIHHQGIADVGSSKPSSNFAQSKPRFDDSKSSTPVPYQPAQSDFEKAAGSQRPSHNMMTPEKPRGDWMSHPQTPDAVYDAAPGAFVEKKGPTSFASGATRFKDASSVTADATTASLTSDFEKATSISKPSAQMAAGAPRFGTPKNDTPDATYSTNKSDFDTGSAKPSHNMLAPDHRGDWMTQTQSPNASYDTAPGAFVDKKGQSTFSNAGAPRFKDQSAHETTEATTAAPVSDFQKATSQAKPSAQMAASAPRFKDNTVSYGDPGAHPSAADLDRRELQQRIDRQKRQAEAVGQRDIAKYHE